MPDIRIVWDAAQSHGDWVLAGADLLTGSDLPTAMMISIFSDAMAATDERIPDGSGDPRGWWGDQFDQEHPIGSKIWLLDREKQTKETLNKAYDYIAECLQWLIDDGVVSRFDIQVQWVRDSFLGAQVVAYAPNGTALNTGKYLWAWTGVS